MVGGQTWRDSRAHFEIVVGPMDDTMINDAMALLRTRSSDFNTLALVTGDSDFIDVVRAYREEGKHVAGFGDDCLGSFAHTSRGNVSLKLRGACDSFHFVW